MIIDEWGGWKWTCFNCDHIDRDATDKEIEAYEEEIKKILNRITTIKG
jgi:hypothetical protein